MQHKVETEARHNMILDIPFSWKRKNEIFFTIFVKRYSKKSYYITWDNSKETECKWLMLEELSIYKLYPDT